MARPRALVRINRLGNGNAKDSKPLDTGLAREGLYRALSPYTNREFATVMQLIQALSLKLGMPHAELAALTDPDVILST